MRRTSPLRLHRSSNVRLLALAAVTAALFSVDLTMPSLPGSTVEAAVGKGKNQQLEVASTPQGGGIVTTGKFRQQVTIGDVISSVRISGSRFRIAPGFLGSGSGATATAPVSDLTLSVLYARTDPFGSEIEPAVWQKDRDPVFYWQPPAAGPDVAGYSYAIDSAPDDQVDTAETSFNLATSGQPLSDGKHTFSVKALNTAGNGGSPISMELWVDTTPPQIVSYTPSPGTLTNANNPAATVTVSDAGSGVDSTTVTLFVNGSAASMGYNSATGVFAATGAAWREGENNLEVRAVDALGNTQTPLVWSFTMDTKPPSGTVVINGGAAMTTSVYVTLGIKATDAVSQIRRMLISNEEAGGYVEEPHAALRERWMLNAIRGMRKVYIKFVDSAGNMSAPVSDDIDLALLSPETVIVSGPAGFSPDSSASFGFMCPGGDCVFSYAFDNDDWSPWSPSTTVRKEGLSFGNHYFRVKAAKDLNGTPEIQPDEEDPSPAERTWIVGIEPSVLPVPKGPPIKLWRLE